MKIVGGAAAIEDTGERAELDDMVWRVNASELDDPVGDWGALSSAVDIWMCLVCEVRA
jgi:hypothetical protein